MDNELLVFINNLENKKLKLIDIDSDNELFEYYHECMDEINDSYSPDYVLDMIYNSPYLNLYIESLKSLELDKLYSSDIHGLPHIIRCTLLFLIYSSISKIDYDSFKIILTSLIYHDIGRVNDIDDDNHGHNAAKKIDYLIKNINSDELNIIKVIIICHCLDDDKFEDISSDFDLKNIDMVKELLFILKDIDALDRVREFPYCNLKMLRNEISKKLLPFACVLFNSYNIMVEKI